MCTSISQPFLATFLPTPRTLVISSISWYQSHLGTSELKGQNGWWSFSTSASLTLWAGRFFVVGVVLCIGGCLAASRPPPTRCQ